MHFLEQHSEKVVLYYFFSSFDPEGNNVGHMLKCLTAQLVQRHQDLSAYIHKEYIEKCLSPTVARLKTLLFQLVASSKDVRICIDGLDECAKKDQASIILSLLPFINTPAAGTVCKILLTSRDIQSISKHLKERVTISLSEERQFIDPAIKYYIQESTNSLQGQLENLGQQEDLVARIQNELVAKADGNCTHGFPSASH